MFALFDCSESGFFLGIYSSRENAEAAWIEYSLDRDCEGMDRIVEIAVDAPAEQI